MTPEEIRLHFSYSGWASRKLLEAALALPEEQQHREERLEEHVEPTDYKSHPSTKRPCDV